MQKKYSDIIKQRRSVRSYIHEPLADDLKSKMVDYISAIDGKPLGIKTRFSLIEAGRMGKI